LGDQLGLDRLEVDLLHTQRRLLGRQRRDLVEQRLRIVVASPEAFEVEHTDAAELAELDRRRRAHDTVHGRCHERKVEPVRVDFPRNIDVFGVAGAPRRNDCDVIEPVGAATGLTEANLNFGHSFHLNVTLKVEHTQSCSLVWWICRPFSLVTAPFAHKTTIDPVSKRPISRSRR